MGDEDSRYKNMAILKNEKYKEFCNQFSINSNFKSVEMNRITKLHRLSDDASMVRWSCFADYVTNFMISKSEFGIEFAIESVQISQSIKRLTNYTALANMALVCKFLTNMDGTVFETKIKPLLKNKYGNSPQNEIIKKMWIHLKSKAL